MQLKQSVHLLLIALFVWAYQTTTIHYQHHVFEENSECKVCEASKEMQLYQHSTPVLVFTENIAVNIRKRVEKVIVKVKSPTHDAPQFMQIGIVKHTQYTDSYIALGFHAKAPPVVLL